MLVMRANIDLHRIKRMCGLSRPRQASGLSGHTRINERYDERRKEDEE